MRNRTPRFRHDRRSIAALEFALVAPLLILLGLGAIEFAAAIRVQLGADHAARAVASLISQAPVPTVLTGGNAKCPSITQACITAAALQDIYIGGLDSNEGLAQNFAISAATVVFSNPAGQPHSAALGWDAATAPTTPAYAPPPANLLALAAGLTDGVDTDSVIVVQASTSYTLPFLPAFFGAIGPGPFTFTFTSLARPRNSLVIAKGW
jgi:Flp pilus assembly protein TadG